MKTLKHNFLAASAYGKRLPAKKIRSGLFVVAVFAGLAGLIALTDPPKSAAGPGPSNVVVVNKTLGGPNLPVEGNVGITGTPTVNVATLPAVNLAGGASVLVGNAAGSPVPIRDLTSVLKPVQFSAGVTIADTADVSSAASYTVPDGERLVIEYVSTYENPGAAGQAFYVDVVSTASSVVSENTLMMTPPSTGFLRVSEGQQVRIYADKNSAVSLYVYRSGNTTGIVGAVVNFSGYLVDLP